MQKDTGLTPGPGRPHVPRRSEAHAPQLLSLRSRAREARLPIPAPQPQPVPGAALHNRRSRRDEPPARCGGAQPPAEKDSAAKSKAHG